MGLNSDKTSEVFCINCQHGRTALDGLLALLAARCVYFLFLLSYCDFMANKYDNDDSDHDDDDGHNIPSKYSSFRDFPSNPDKETNDSVTVWLVTRWT